MRLVFLLLLALAVPAAAWPGLDISRNSTWLELDGYRMVLLFDSPAAPSKDRAFRAEAALVQILENPSAPPLTVGERDGQVVVVSGNQVVVEVLESDAAVFGSDRRSLAATWIWVFGHHLDVVRQERVGSFWARALGHSLVIVLVAGLVSLLGTWLLHRGRMHSLPLRGALWATALSMLCVEFPATRRMGNLALDKLVAPLWVTCLVLLGASLLARAVNRSLDVYFADLEKFWRRHADLQPRPQRTRMMRQGVGVVVQAGVVTSALLVGARLLGVDVAAAATGAGVFGVGVSLIARDLLSDWFAGVQIIIEDQFGVGDTITVGTFTGEVENFSLRFTRIRLEDGSLVTASNSSVRTVVNHETTNLVIVPWVIPAEVDVRAALETARAAAQALVEEPGTSLCGVSAQGTTLQIFVPVKPGGRAVAGVRQELLLRLTEAFQTDAARCRGLTR